MSKKIIWIIVAAIVVVGGSVSAYFLIAKSDKAEYFKAEQATFEFMKDKTSEQFEPALDWNEKMREEPMDASAELSGEFQAPSGQGDLANIEDIVNNASLTFNTQTDLEGHQMRAGVDADIASFKLEDFNMYIDEDNMALDLPFLDDTLKIQDSDLSEMLQEMDPEAEDIDFDFESIFDSAQGLPEEDIEHLKEEYIISVYDNLPKDAFDSEKETIEVAGEDVSAEKITMDLSEAQIKDVFVEILEKAQNDEELQELIKEQMQAQALGVSAESAEIDLETDVDELFNEDIDEAIDVIENDLQMPDGLTSAVWVDGDLIAKRDLSVSFANADDESVEFNVIGTNALDDEQQKYNYDLSVVDPNDEKHEAEITADMSMKDGKIEDTVELAAAGATLTYEEDSTLDDGERDFERTLNINSQEEGVDASLVWSGNAEYEEDQASSNNELTLETDMLGDIDASLFIDTESKIIKEVEMPDEDSVKDLGDMSESELQQYIQDVVPKAQEWFMEQFGGFGGSGPQPDDVSEDPFADGDADDEDVSADKEEFEDADEETTSFKQEEVGADVTVNVDHKKDMVTNFEQKTTIHYEEAGVDKNELKESIEEGNDELQELDAVEVDYDYGDDEAVETMSVNPEDGQLEVMKQIMGDTGNDDFVSLEGVTEYLESQGFEEQ